MTAVYGQSDAVALAVVAMLTDPAASLSLAVEVERRFARRLDFADLGGVTDPVTIEVIPGDDMADLEGLNGIFDDTYGCHVVILQNVAAATGGGLDEDQPAALLRLRSEIVEYLCKKVLNCPEAVHPFSGARVKAVRHGREGVYDLARLEETNVFYSELIFTWKAAGITRRPT